MIFTSILAIIALANILYLLNKDNINKGENEVNEMLKTVKQSLDECFNDSKNTQVAAANIESLTYLRIAKENKLSIYLLKFSLALNDYQESNKNIEQLIGEYKTLLEKIYNVKYSLLEYLSYTFFRDLELINKFFKK